MNVNEFLSLIAYNFDDCFLLCFFVRASTANVENIFKIEKLEAQLENQDGGNEELNQQILDLEAQLDLALARNRKVIISNYFVGDYVRI